MDRSKKIKSKALKTATRVNVREFITQNIIVVATGTISLLAIMVLLITSIITATLTTTIAYRSVSGIANMPVTAWYADCASNRCVAGIQAPVGKKVYGKQADCEKGKVLDCSAKAVYSDGKYATCEQVACSWKTKYLNRKICEILPIGDCAPGTKNSKGPGKDAILTNSSPIKGGKCVNYEASVNLDCTTPPPSSCGNGSCANGETCVTCPSDCGTCPPPPPPPIVIVPPGGVTPPVVTPPGGGVTPPIVTPPGGITPPGITPPGTNPPGGITPPGVTPPGGGTPPGTTPPGGGVTPPIVIVPPGGTTPPGITPPGGTTPPSGGGTACAWPRMPMMDSGGCVDCTAEGWMVNSNKECELITRACVCINDLASPYCQCGLLTDDKIRNSNTIRFNQSVLDKLESSCPAQYCNILGASGSVFKGAFQTPALSAEPLSNAAVTIKLIKPFDDSILNPDYSASATTGANGGWNIYNNRIISGYYAYSAKKAGYVPGCRVGFVPGGPGSVMLYPIKQESGRPDLKPQMVAALTCLESKMALESIKKDSPFSGARIVYNSFGRSDGCHAQGYGADMMVVKGTTAYWRNCEILNQMAVSCKINFGDERDQKARKVGCDSSRENATHGHYDLKVCGCSSGGTKGNCTSENSTTVADCFSPTY